MKLLKSSYSILWFIIMVIYFEYSKYIIWQEGSVYSSRLNGKNKLTPFLFSAWKPIFKSIDHVYPIYLF